MNTLSSAVFLLVVCAVTSVHLAELKPMKPVCRPDACFTVKCGIPPECRNITVPINDPKKDHLHDAPRYRIIRNGGYCGCCDLCQTLLRENEKCSLISTTGMASSAVCNDGLKCDLEKLICVKV